MKNHTLLNSNPNHKMLVIVVTFIAMLFTQLTNAQNYRTIDAYMDDFGKNEMFVKKALIDYSVTIVESQMGSRSKVTSDKIVDKLTNLNRMIKSTKGFEDNTLLRDSFVQMNEKTIASLKNGSLILNDYDQQSALPFNAIQANMSQKEKDMVSYYQAIKNHEKNKIAFGAKYNIGFKSHNTKNVLEYNAYENFLFYKINVLDQKLVTLIAAKDKAGVAECFKNIEALHQEVMTKTNQYKNLFKDSSINDANVAYANFINAQKGQLATLFNDYADANAALAILKKSTEPQTNAFVAAYNEQVKTYNAKKNAFYAMFDKLQTSKKAMHDNWFNLNAKFLQNNAEFENIHDRYTLSDSKLATR